MALTRREFVAGTVATMALVQANEVWAQTGDASAYFAGSTEDNGVTFRTTNFGKVAKP